MRKNDHNDRDIEELLKQMPKIKDQRGKREVYQNVMMKMNRRKRQTWLIPSAAAAAALLLMVILIPGMMGGQDTAEDSSSGSQESAQYSAVSEESAERSSENSQDDAESTSDDSAVLDSSEKKNESTQNDSSDSEAEVDIQNDFTTAVYEEDLQESEVLTYVIPDKNINNIVPVSVIVPKEEGKTKFDLYKETMPKLTEEQWGLSEFYPLNADLTYDQNQNILNVDMPSDHQYHFTSVAEVINNFFINIFKEFNLQEIKLTTDGNPGVDLGNYGEISEFTPNNSSNQYAFYLFYPDQDMEEPFLVPYTHDERPQSIEEAFNAMRQEIEIDPPLMASIPADINFQTDVHDHTVVITFSDESEIEDNEETAYMIEALLLTAKEFNYQAVKLENADVDTVGRFNLTQELHPPVAPNQKELP
ncbi:GerMN domain-containing protein [Cytobacillus gottheilii]|uniref:GerMN domain-containing protein n=1 Tax=Cytobacillus gottheilii TaxID=859144 RepID=UPI0009B9F219|nr:GerMN domain-containing protein [Cytobacillus gottheilii]